MHPGETVSKQDQYEYLHGAYNEAMSHMLGLPTNTMHYEIPYKPWEVVGAHIFMVNNKSLLCIVDYYSKFPIVKKVAGLSAADLLKIAMLIFAEYGLPKRLFQM